MREQQENINISNCPVCGHAHTYSLKITRSLVMTMRVADEKPHKVQMTRLFICPIRETEFQATFAISETLSSPIESVKIVSLEKSQDE